MGKYYKTQASYDLGQRELPEGGSRYRSKDGSFEELYGKNAGQGIRGVSSISGQDSAYYSTPLAARKARYKADKEAGDNVGTFAEWDAKN